MLSNNERMVLRKFLYNRKNLRDFDISQVQQSILLCMLDHNSDIIVTQKKISEEISCAQSSVSRNLIKMIGSGFVKKRRHQAAIYGNPVYFSVYSPSVHLYKIAERWYKTLSKKDSIDSGENDQDDLPINTEKNKKMLEAMNVLKIKKNLWEQDDKEEGSDV